MQTDEKWQQFSERMTYEGVLHAAIDAFDPTPDALARFNERNLHVLRTLASLDERRQENSSDDDNPVMLELQRMDSKINVLLDIVDRLLMPTALLPERYPVRFNAVGVAAPESLLPSSDFLLVRLHFDTCRALPLELPSRLGRRLNDGTAFVYFCELSELVEDGLERFVFCHHRRKVAEARLTASNESVLGSKYRM
ncbi:PilZ domain-containing protein [Dyella caseinilytica]|uniref:PilZ domain-containing protein n=1 Tax=Dyella caseinilytica TaxID=1849581 RepID=A0ABX7GSP6_9GAMM|nr:PilZ domain-containing protein [Dyella caseinilytica]QRN53406.1 PilZ domain-containing protein [Dyella caseinilytica]GFZ86279.1 hypothetical protein GCM10011408_00770 [Dyella caseinilytica]